MVNRPAVRRRVWLQAYHDECCQDIGDISLSGLHQVEVGGVVLLIHEQLVHSDDAGCDGDHGQPGLPGLLLVPHIQLSMQLLCKALHAGKWGSLGLAMVLDGAAGITLSVATNCCVSSIRPVSCTGRWEGGRGKGLGERGKGSSSVSTILQP